jgi:hypothetical protein
MTRTMGIICLTLCGIWILQGLFGMTYTTVSGPNEYRFDGVRAAEGTTLTVKDGQLELAGGGHFSVDTPLRRIVDQSLSGLFFLATLGAGIMLLRTAPPK